MQGRAERTRRWLVILLIAHSLAAPTAWADAGKDRPDRLCEKAEIAERDAREAERKSEERRRFLKMESSAPGSRPLPGGDTAALRQSVKSRTAQARAILSQLRQGADSAKRDRGIVPGLEQYFTQMESGIGRMLQSIDGCLDNPENCNVPSTACPSPPAMPSFNHSGSADFIRRTQQTYAQAANQARQACLNLNGELRGEVERLKRESRSAATKSGIPASDAAERFGEADLQLRRAEALRREALQARQEADRASGISGYCSVNSRPRKSPAMSRAVVDLFRAAGKRERQTAGIPLDGKVVDLKGAWDAKWNKGKTLAPSGVPLPKVSVGKGGEATPLLSDELAKEIYSHTLDVVSPIPLEKAIAWYREADAQVELTELLTPPSPKEFLKDQAKEMAADFLVKASGPFGRSVEAGIKILGAVKGTTEEIGEILEDAPKVIGSGSAADAQELADRAGRVPVLFLNSLFDDVTGEIDLPKQRYQYKKGWDDRP